MPANDPVTLALAAVDTASRALGKVREDEANHGEATEVDAEFAYLGALEHLAEAVRADRARQNPQDQQDS